MIPVALVGIALAVTLIVLCALATDDNVLRTISIILLSCAAVCMLAYLFTTLDEAVRPATDPPLTISGVGIPVYVAAQAPSCGDGSNGLVYVVTDAISEDDCVTGSGRRESVCVCVDGVAVPARARK